MDSRKAALQMAASQKGMAGLSSRAAHAAEANGKDGASVPLAHALLAATASGPEQALASQLHCGWLWRHSSTASANQHALFALLAATASES